MHTVIPSVITEWGVNWIKRLLGHARYDYRCYAATLVALSQGIIASCDADTTHMYVANQLSQSVSVIDAQTQQVINTLHGFVRPINVAWDGATGMYVADISPNPGRVFVVDTINNNLSQISGPFNRPFAMALNGGTGMYVSNFDDGTVSIVDIQTLAVGQVLSIPGATLGSMARDGGTGMYIIDNAGNNIYVIDVNLLSVSAVIPVGDGPNDLAWDGATGMYVCAADVGQVDVINTQTQEYAGSITLADGAFYVAWDGATGMYVTNGEAVNVIDTQTLQPAWPPITVGHLPGLVAWDGGTGMYVVNFGTTLFNGDVSVIDTRTFEVVNTIKDGNYPVGIARAVLTPLPPPSPPQSAPLLLLIDLTHIAEAALQLPQGAPVSLFGKPIPDISGAETANILVMADHRVMGTVTVDFIAGMATSDNPAVIVSIVEDVDAGVAVVRIEMAQS